MTIIVGFVPRRGDSIRNNTSSLGESAESNEGQTTEEGAVKLVQFSPNSAAAWAGDAHEGRYGMDSFAP